MQSKHSFDADDLERLATARVRVSPGHEAWLIDRLLAEAKRLRECEVHWKAHPEEYSDDGDPTFITDYEYRELMERPPTPDESQRKWTEDEQKPFLPRDDERYPTAEKLAAKLGREPTQDELDASGCLQPAINPNPPANWRDEFKQMKMDDVTPVDLSRWGIRMTHAMDSPFALALEAAVSNREPDKLEDFAYYLPDRKALHLPTRALWNRSSIDDMIEPISKLETACDWVVKNNPVHGMTWSPPEHWKSGEGAIIHGRLMTEDGWEYRDDHRCFNRYIKPRLNYRANIARAFRWVEHIKLLYPNDWEHIVNWCAHRVQRPGEKINHILVLGGAPGIGKDSIIEPLKFAVGASNFQDESAARICTSDFNGYLVGVVLRINEAHDFGDGNRRSFYEKMKLYGAAPPGSIRINQKNMPEYYIPNVVGIAITTNYKTDGMYIAREDRRHYIAWSDMTRLPKPTAGNPLCDDYFRSFHHWLTHDGGNGDVAWCLRTHDLSNFDPKSPPLKTPAFYEIAGANASAEDAPIQDAIDRIGNPQAVTIRRIAAACDEATRLWLLDRRNSRAIAGRLERAGYVRVDNPARPSDGRWLLPSWTDEHAERHFIYALKSLSEAERVKAAEVLVAYGETRPQ